MNNNERKEKFIEKLNGEFDNYSEVCLWMSFCDTEKPKGSQFLGVIITKSLGLAHAIDKTHKLGINPGGEIQSFEIDTKGFDESHFDRLLSHENLQKFGYAD